MQRGPIISIGAAAIMAVVAVALWLIPQDPPVVPPVPEAEPTASAPEVLGPAAGADVAVAMPAPEIPPDEPLPKPRVVVSPEALRDMEDVQFMLRDFRTRIGGNPEGTNAEIMKQVIGGNRFQARLGPPEGQSLNEEGELVDRWGSPYFFHQLSMNEMEIRSFGPDRTMYTADDIVVK